MSRADFRKNLILTLGILAVLLALQFVLPEYHVLMATRMMLLAVFALGYNALLGYAGLLSLGHALFFAFGLYTAGLTVYHLNWPLPLAFVGAILSSALLALVIGAVTLRTARVSFMIVTLMFAQAGYLLVLYLSALTNGQEGLSLPPSARSIPAGNLVLDLTDAATRYNLAFALLAASLLILLFYLRGRRGRIITAIRDNEERTTMLGFNVFAGKLEIFTLSGALSGASGAAYGLLFGYLGATFASFQYSIEALLFTLLGGAGTLLGPLIGVALMVVMIDKLGEITNAYLLVIGLLLIALILWFPKGILGSIRERWAPWLL
ncbi:branched-chain amino acid ABC transporter permease [Rhizobium sp. SSA_523]|uniref:branched-chain amino acid ABC transporter permease n=1 Tax=Rhizobium sp. SSA_523 TaxID=2952477 RepID=UPI00209153EA|nr:branched-chain amino acid ABC transporter permease [Rhizobium sp. SSA_523]MCO5732234.1 branched-chain amino acid ABC transporter permease [Rhizobium sp. SSA_523]WKC21356.1 branched-chain amino acid ABC transporter permease [Rhizobium sp. SSA_523]